MNLIEHTVRLAGKKATLRPMTENDWEVLFRWNNDPEVLYYAESEDTGLPSMDQVRNIYRTVSQNAYCFIIESNRQPVGECWLQKMNLERIKKKYPVSDCRRIDLMIGEKELWGKGIGTETISLLTAFAFGVEMADYVFGCDIAGENTRSLRAFSKNGFVLESRNPQPPGRKFIFCCDLVLTRTAYDRR